MPVSTASPGLQLNSLTTSGAGAVTGNVYAMPGGAPNMITWQVVADGSTISVNLEGSNDNSAWSTLDSITTPATGSIRNTAPTSVKFIRISQVSRTGGTATTGTLVVSSGSVASGTPGSITAGRFLVSDGTAAAPAFRGGASLADGWIGAVNNGVTKYLFGASEFRMGNSVLLGWSPNTDPNVSGADTQLARSAAGKVVLTGTTPMFQLGGTTSSFPALKQVGQTFQVRVADDSGFGTLTAGILNSTTNIQVGNGSPLIVGTAPTISSGFGTSPSIVTPNGTAAFTINVGTGAAASSGVIGLPAATNGWNAFITDITAALNHTGLRTWQTASTTNTVTIESQNSAGAATAWASGSILRVSCFAY
jgi:hypothetical protein